MAFAKGKKLRLEKEEDIARWLHDIVEAPMMESPIDINIGHATEIELPSLRWHNFHIPPKKMKLTNTGYTVILSGKWTQDRPYLTGGPLVGPYVFSQLHLHWGSNDMEGSEHAVDGRRYPMEMHAIFFRSCYLTQESALKERDGVIVLVYFCELSKKSNPIFENINKNLKNLKKPFTYARIPPISLNNLFREFTEDYFAYWGSISMESCMHYILWMVCRHPTNLTSKQLKGLRGLIAIDDKPLKMNYRKLQPLKNRNIFHVLPSNNKSSTLLS